MRNKFFNFSVKMKSEDLFNKLSKPEKEILNEFSDYLLITASESRVKEAIREVLRFRYMINKKLDNINLEDLRYFLKEIKQSDFGDLTKNKIKGFVYRFLKWKYKNWSELFNAFEDLNYNNDAERQKPINSKTILTKQDIEKIMKAENSLFWKTFFIVQYEGALRTGEVRKLTWDCVKFEEDGFVTLEITSKKNKNAKEKKRRLPLKQSYFYLERLKKETKDKGINTKWVFYSRNPKEYISKSVNVWFNNLTKKAIGREVTPYMLRHTRATELKTLVKENKMSKDNAVEFMGHSEEMFDKTYSHMDEEDIKELMKKQIYDFEYMPKEKKHALELEIEELKKNSVSKEDVLRMVRQALMKTTKEIKS